MRRRTKLHSTTLSLALLSQALFALVTPGIVLCQEAGGRTVAELGFTGCCEPAADLAAVLAGPGAALRSIQSQLAVSSSDDCGPCDDASLDLHLGREDSSVGPELAAAVLAPLPGGPQPLVLAGRLAAPFNPPPDPAGRAFLKTVVLRC